MTKPIARSFLYTRQGNLQQLEKNLLETYLLLINPQNLHGIFEPAELLLAAGPAVHSTPCFSVYQKPHKTTNNRVHFTNFSPTYLLDSINK